MMLGQWSDLCEIILGERMLTPRKPSGLQDMIVLQVYLCVDWTIDRTVKTFLDWFETLVMNFHACIDTRNRYGMKT